MRPRPGVWVTGLVMENSCSDAKIVRRRPEAEWAEYRKVGFAGIKFR
jgi:hypothetical protein